MAGPRVGAEVAGYRLESVIARGGMSTVFLAEHLGLARRVALKILASELSEDDTFRERFVRESRIAAGLDHPNIIPIYEAGEFEGLLFIAMRYVQGSHLKALLERVGPLEPRRLLPILSQTAGALDAAHSRGLIHRDVKPGNILIDPEVGPEHEDHVYLCDFGLTKQGGTHSGLTRTGQFVGTIDYISPEQIEGKEVDARTDIYSLGCVLYECLTGLVPFEKPSEAAVLWAHVQEQPTPVSQRRPELPPDIDRVVARSMAKSPDDRYQSCSEMVTDLRRSLGGVRAGPAPDETVFRTSADLGPPPPPPPPGRGSDAGQAAPTRLSPDAQGQPSGPQEPPRLGASRSGEPSPRRPTGAWQRSARVFTAVAAVCALLIGLGIGWAIGNDSGTDPAGGADAAMHDEAEPVKGGELYRFLLLEHIPATYQGLCSAVERVPPKDTTLVSDHGVFAVAHCDPEGYDVNFYLLHSNTAMGAVFFDIVTQKGATGLRATALAAKRLNGIRAKLTEEGYGEDALAATPGLASRGSTCDGSYASGLADVWYSTGDGIGHTESPQPGELPKGLVACFKTGELPTVVWTDTETTLLGIATGQTAAVLHWWETEAGPAPVPVSGPEMGTDTGTASPSPMDG